MSGCPALLGYHGPSGKVLVASGGKVGARRAYKDTFLLKTVLQGPANNKTDDIAMEIPTAMVSGRGRRVGVFHTLSEKVFEYIRSVTLRHMPTSSHFFISRTEERSWLNCASGDPTAR